MRLHRQIGTAVLVLTIVAGTFTAIGPDARHQLSTMLGLTQATPAAEAELPGLVEAAERKLGKSFSEMQAEYDQAVANGVPLALAGITDVEAAQLAAQGSNVVVDCAATNREVNDLNELLAQAPGASLISCGGHSAEAPVAQTALVVTTALDVSDLSDAEKAEYRAQGFDSVGDCDGISGVLSGIFSGLGSDGWSCGYSTNN